MTMIQAANIQEAYEYIKGNCAALRRSIFEYHFLGGSSNAVFDKLRAYQNKDGGFGHGLEPDFMLPESSPMATTIAFQIMNELDTVDQDMISKAIRYYDATFDKKRNGWWSVPKAVNDHPHAPWWNYDSTTGQTIIDNHWGNPSAEILGQLYTWRDCSVLDINDLMEFAIRHIDNLTEFVSPHELYCYIRTFPTLPKSWRKKLKGPISEGIRALMCLNEEQWNTYVPKPFDFIQSRAHPLFHLIENHSEQHCDYLTKTIQSGLWSPTWTWGGYEEDWKKSEKEWTAILTTRNLRILRECNRIQGYVDPEENERR